MKSTRKKVIFAALRILGGFVSCTISRCEQIMLLCFLFSFRPMRIMFVSVELAASKHYTLKWNCQLINIFQFNFWTSSYTTPHHTLVHLFPHCKYHGEILYRWQMTMHFALYAKLNFTIVVSREDETCVIISFTWHMHLTFFVGCFLFSRSLACSCQIHFNFYV